MRADWSDALILAGIGALLCGLWLLVPALAITVGGLLALGWGLLLGMARRR